MRKLLVAVIMLLAFVVPVAAANDDKVTICHVPPGNPENVQTITIDEHALQAHLGDNEEGLHGGDYRGECLVEATPTPTPTPEIPVVVVPTPTPVIVPRTVTTPSVEPVAPVIPNTAMQAP